LDSSDVFLPYFPQSPNREDVERISTNINAFGVNRQTQSSKKERGLHLVVSNDEKKLEALEAKRTSLL
jgi:hypothetical protein